MSCPWGDGRGRHVKNVRGCGCPDDPDLKSGNGGKNEPPDRDGQRCPQCHGKLRKSAPRGGHDEKCPVYVRSILTPPRNRPRPSVTIPRHQGPWSRPGGPYVNPAGIRVRDYTCKTCGRVVSTLASSGEPSLWCPEVRGK